MRFLWLACMPMLFLPSMGFGSATRFGTLELSDLLIGPFLVVVGLAVGHRGERLIAGRLAAVLLGFTGWTLVSTLLVRERYGYPDHLQVVVGVLKLAKLVLYGTAGVFVARALADESQRRWYPWSLLVAGIVVGFTLFQSRGLNPGSQPGQVLEGYKAKNAISVMMAMLVCYLVGIWINGNQSQRWRQVALPGLAVMMIGFLVSDGRGGWLAALVGVAYLFYREGIRTRVLVGLACVAVLVVICYGTLPEFRTEIDRTIWPDQRYLETYKAGIGGVDDGARWATWMHEAAKFTDSPLLGRGFFHRGFSSGLWSTGSHNFWLQVFLETGAVGGVLVLASLAQMWSHAGTPLARASGLESPVKSAVLAAFVGGLGEAYFYGGMVLFVLLLTYAPVGALVDHSAQTEG